MKKHIALFVALVIVLLGTTQLVNIYQKEEKESENFFMDNWQNNLYITENQQISLKSKFYINKEEDINGKGNTPFDYTYINWTDYLNEIGSSVKKSSTQLDGFNIYDIKVDLKPKSLLESLKIYNGFIETTLDPETPNVRTRLNLGRTMISIMPEYETKLEINETNIVNRGEGHEDEYIIIYTLTNDQPEALTISNMELNKDPYMSLELEEPVTILPGETKDVHAHLELIDKVNNVVINPLITYQINGLDFTYIPSDTVEIIREKPDEFKGLIPVDLKKAERII